MKKILISGLLGISLCACSSVAENYRANPILKRHIQDQTASTIQTGQEPPKPESSSPASPSYYSKDGKSIDVTSKEFTDYIKDIDSEATINQQNYKRSKLAREIMSLSDDICELHLASIISNANTWNIFTGTTSSLLSGLGTVVSGESIKAGFSAGAALTNSTRALVNQEIYANALSTTIVRAIELKRKEKRDAIDSYLASTKQNTSTWEVLYMIDGYHKSCSFITGLIEVTKALENRKPSVTLLKERLTVLSKMKTDNIGDSTEIDAAVKELTKQLSSATDN